MKRSLGEPLGMVPGGLITIGPHGVVSLKLNSRLMAATSSGKLPYCYFTGFTPRRGLIAYFKWVLISKARRKKHG